MLKKFQHKFTGTEEAKLLVTNVFFLSLLQGANYILPLLSLPYLVRVLGPEYFGLLAFATATISYFMLITDYGFNLSATRQISIYRKDKGKVNEIFSSVMIIKISLMIISFGLILLLVFGFEKFSQHKEVYLITFGTVVGQVLFPVWFFQGMERMKYITYLNITTKTLFTICIFVFVQEKEDYLLVPILAAMGNFVAGVWSLYLIKKEFDVSFFWQKTEALKLQLIEGWHVFFSSMAISLYTISTTFILGLFTNNTIVGYFAAADKIVQAVKGLYSPISQAIYPLIGKKIHEDKEAGLAFIHKTTWIVGVGMFCMSVFLFLMAEPIVIILLGDQFKESIDLLIIMSFLPFIIAMSNIYGIQTLLNLGFKKEFSSVLIAAGLLGIIFGVLLVLQFNEYGSAVNVVLIELFVLVCMRFYVKEKV